MRDGADPVIEFTRGFPGYFSSCSGGFLGSKSGVGGLLIRLADLWGRYRA